jgi:23S rRNA (uracil1939-C5)-methyltransferase
MKNFRRETFTGTCVDLSSEGKGVVKYDDTIVFVDGLFVGEKADIEILYYRAGVAFGRVKKLYSLSKDRVQPRCKVCTACGGCQFQQLNYNAQLLYKKNKVYNDLTRIGHLSNFEIFDTIKADNPYNYRNKIQVPVGYNFKHQIVSGFYREKSHEIIPIDECYIEDTRAPKIIKTIKDLMLSFKMTPYNEDNGVGLLRHILIRTSHYQNEIMVVLVTSKPTFPGRNNFVKELISRCPEITTIVNNINSRHTNVILGEHEEVLYGKGFIEDTLCGLSFRISSKSFYQINPLQCEKLYRKALEFAQLSKDETVLDAYSGIGTIGLIAAKDAKEVISVEIVKEATLDGIRNAKANNITNIKFINDDATKYILKAKLDKIKIDCVLLDPPRNGSTPEFLNSVLELEPKKVVYVSCEPSTLARDLEILSKKYKIDKVQPVDMFPMTFHVETVVSLKLK